MQLAAKPIRIEKIDILGARLPDYARLHIVCGKGTYIRSLVRDIGEALQSGAHMTSLRRTRVGDISVENCFTLEAFEEWLAAQTIEIPAEFANGPQIKAHQKDDRRRGIKAPASEIQAPTREAATPLDETQSKTHIILLLYETFSVNFKLPAEKIAKYPSPLRDDCRMMVLDKTTGKDKTPEVRRTLGLLRREDLRLQ